MLPLIAGIVAQLVSNNLPKVAQAVVDKGVGYVETKLGIPLAPNMTPEQLEQVRVESQKHEEFMSKLDFDNTQGARTMQMAALAQSDVFSKRFVYYFISFWSVISAVYVGVASFGTIPLANTHTVDTVLGIILGTIITGMFNFLIGSTITSRQKNELLAQKAQDGSLGQPNP